MTLGIMQPYFLPYIGYWFRRGIMNIKLEKSLQNCLCQKKCVTLQRKNNNTRG